MKTHNLHQKALLYDRDCPMCSMYTGYFVNSGILGENGRIPFDTMPENVQCQIDTDRARHEIALVDYEGGETMYGLEGLFHIVGTKLPIAKPLFRFGPFRTFMKGVYKTITYNRRMMAGKAGTDACKPDFNLTWRTTYLVLATLVALPLLLLTGNTLLGGELGWLFPTVAAATLVLQGGLTLHLNYEQRMDYLGNLATLLIISTIVVVPALLASAITGLALPWLFIGLLALGQFLMYRGHFRRLNSFELPKALGWILPLTLATLGTCAWLLLGN